MTVGVIHNIKCGYISFCLLSFQFLSFHLSSLQFLCVTAPQCFYSLVGEPSCCFWMTKVMQLSFLYISCGTYVQKFLFSYLSVEIFWVCKYSTVQDNAKLFPKWIVAVYASRRKLRDYTEPRPLQLLVLSIILKFYNTNNSEKSSHFVLDYTYMISDAVVDLYC